MEIKATLNKPYTEKQRLDFIVENNHNSRYLIEETETALVAKGYTQAEIAAQKAEQLKKEFFNTSLGYVRRKVTMTTGEIRDFLFDIKPTLQIGVPIITYNLDGSQNTDKLVTKEFLAECDKQIYFDFYGTYPQTEND